MPHAFGSGKLYLYHMTACMFHNTVFSVYPKDTFSEV